MGVVAATRRGKKTDDGLLGFSLFTYAAPEYWIGIILILVFAVWIPIFPAGLQVTPGEEFSSFFAKAWRRRQAPGAAGHGDDADAAGPVLPDHALVDGGRADRGLHHRQAGDRAALGAGGAPPRGAERAAAAGDAVGDPVRGGRRRRDHDRDDLLLAGPGRAELPGDQRQGLPGAAGDLPGLLRRGDPGQPARRLPLLLPRPAGAGDDDRAGRQRARSCAAVRDEPARSATAAGTWRGRIGLGVAVRLHGGLRQPDRPLRPERLEPRRAGAAQHRALARDDRERLGRLLADAGRARGSRSWSGSPRR